MKAKTLEVMVAMLEGHMEQVTVFRDDHMGATVVASGGDRAATAVALRLLATGAAALAQELDDVDGNE